jgi:DNA-binding transcriptional regulator YiaG
MKKQKTETFIYEGLGFPIKLIDVPMKKMCGEWVIDIDMVELQLVVLHYLAYKPARLTKDELRFIRKFLVMTTTDFGKIFGVTHAAVLQWENGKRQLTPSTEFCIRLRILSHLKVKDKEFRNLYNTVSLEKLSNKESKKIVPLKIDASENLKIAQ